VLVSLDVAKIELDPRDGRAVLLLVHKETERIFPLWLGDDEAAAIARALARAPQAPGPIELLASTIRTLGASVAHVELTGAVHRVVTAAVMLVDGLGQVALPARASDAVALAIQLRAPVMIPEELLAQVAARVADAEARTQSRPPAAAEPLQLSPAERWNALLAHLGTSADKTYEG
jgi:bifunctional DNase/RNase